MRKIKNNQTVLTTNDTFKSFQQKKKVPASLDFHPFDAGCCKDILNVVRIFIQKDLTEVRHNSILPMLVIKEKIEYEVDRLKNISISESLDASGEAAQWGRTLLLRSKACTESGKSRMEIHSTQSKDRYVNRRKGLRKVKQGQITKNLLSPISCQSRDNRFSQEPAQPKAPTQLEAEKAPTQPRYVLYDTRLYKKKSSTLIYQACIGASQKDLEV